MSFLDNVLGLFDREGSGAGALDFPDLRNLPLRDILDLFGLGDSNIAGSGADSGAVNRNFDRGSGLSLSDIILLASTTGAGAFGEREGTITDETTIDPHTEAQRNKISGLFDQLLNEDPDFAGFSANRTENFNRGAQAKDRATRERLAGRGISLQSPAAQVALNNINNDRVSNIITGLNEIPMLARQNKEKNINDLGSFFNSAPFSSKTVQTQSGNITGGGLTGFASMLARLRGLNA